MPWDLPHIAASLPLAALFGIEVVAAESNAARVRLANSSSVLRSGGSVAGPCLFAMVDIASYALTLILRKDVSAMTSSTFINFLRPAFDLPIICEAVALRTGRYLLAYDVRIWPQRRGTGDF